MNQGTSPRKHPATEGDSNLIEDNTTRISKNQAIRGVLHAKRDKHAHPDTPDGPRYSCLQYSFVCEYSICGPGVFKHPLDHPNENASAERKI